MVEQRQPLNILVCNALVSACASAGRWRHALAFLEEMARLSLEMDVFSWSCAIDACEKAGEWQLALHLCSHLHEMHLAPNVVAMSSAMSACAKASRWEISMLLLGSMSELRVQPNTFSFSAIMAGCQKLGSWHQALYLFRRMSDAALEPDVVSCNAAIEGLAQWEVASHLVNQMDRRSIPVNELSFNTAIGACSKVSELIRVQAIAQTQSQSESTLTGLGRPKSIKKVWSVPSPAKSMGQWGQEPASMALSQEAVIPWSLKLTPTAEPGRGFPQQGSWPLSRSHRRVNAWPGSRSQAQAHHRAGVTECYISAVVSAAGLLGMILTVALFS